jgi:protein-tyrosine-phosphatase
MVDKNFRILFVCTGNTCRSPMAEGILKKMLKEKNIDYIQVSSAGTNSWGGCPVSLSALEMGRLSEIDLKSHSSRKLTKEVLEEADLILAMSKNHLDQVRELNENSINKSFLLKAFPRRSEDESFWIKDPIGGILDDYRTCFRDLDENIQGIFPELIDLAKKKIRIPPK